MKHISITLAFLLLIALLGAQELMPFGNLRHSSRCADGNLRLRWDDFSGGMVLPECYYRANGGAWQAAAAEPYADGVAQALVPYEFGQVLRYRLRLALEYMGESVAYMQPAFWDDDAFPPQAANMALIGTDATGDSVMVYATNLDLTDTFFAATDNKFYSALANVANSFPTMNSLTSYNFWATTIANPEALADSVVFALVYTFNIPGLISPGLYKLGMDSTGTPTFARVGNIQSQVSGGKLYLACNLADLTGDPDFGIWPNAFNALMVTSLSMKIDIDLQTMQPEFGFGDYSSVGMLEFTDYRYQVSQNTLPQYLNFELPQNPPVLSVDYLDADGDFPLIAEFQVEKPVVDTVQLTPNSQDYSQIVNYTTQFSYNPMIATLRFSDNGIDIVEYDYLIGDAPPPGASVPQLSCAMPNPLGPGSNLITLSGLEKGPLEVGIFNLRGQKLAELYQGIAVQPELQLNFSGAVNGIRLGSGIYFLKLRHNGRVVLHRFVISK